jgi:hypothetical protein
LSAGARQIGKAGRPVTHISEASADRVEVRGRDLCQDLMGRLSFTEYFHLLLTGREPTDEQRYFLDVLLVAIAEHGMMPTNVAARMTLAADPASLQGAVAAGILGAGTVIWARPRRAPGCSSRHRTGSSPVSSLGPWPTTWRTRFATPGRSCRGSGIRSTARSIPARNGSSSSPTNTG